MTHTETDRSPAALLEDGAPRAASAQAAPPNCGRQLTREIVGGEPYEYFPLGEHVVAAPGVCGGRPTFKYTRIDVRHAISLLAGGWTVAAVAQSYEIPVAAIQEAIELASRALAERAA